MLSTYLLPLFLPNQVLCYNHLSSAHTILSLLCHSALFVIRKITRQEKEENNLFRQSLLQHYCLIWLSIITSPKGGQLDFWLFTIILMDCLPICISIYLTLKYCFDYEGISDLQLWNLTAFMRQWSPAYQLNNWIMHYVDGCIIKHIYILCIFTLGITHAHRSIATNLYCIRLE